MKEIFLAVFDGTDECKSAVRYAARRAQLNNANLLIVATVDTAEFTYWLSVNSKMIDNIEKESKEMLKVLSKEIQSYSNVECSYIIEHGSKLDVVKRLIDEDETISPNRFRHSFAMRMLNHFKFSLHVVARMKGDTERMVRKH